MPVWFVSTWDVYNVWFVNAPSCYLHNRPFGCGANAPSCYHQHWAFGCGANDILMLSMVLFMCIIHDWYVHKVLHKPILPRVISSSWIHLSIPPLFSFLYYHTQIHHIHTSFPPIHTMGLLWAICTRFLIKWFTMVLLTLLT